MKKRSEPPSSSTSSGSAPKKQQMNSNFFNKPSASTSSSSLNSSSSKKIDPLFQEQPLLKSKGSGGACHVKYGDWKASSKIAAFDLDGTVIKTRSGVKFAKGPTDWIYWNSSVAGALKDLVQRGFSIVFISNQAGLPHVQKAFVEKLALIGAELKPQGVPFRAFGAFDYDQYRKPCVGIWEKFVRDLNDGIPIDYDESFFCGDAAGRPRNISREADHSDCDRKMAHNVGLKFYTPEEYFLKQSVDKNWSWDPNVWNPSTYDQDVPIFSPTNTPLIPKGSNKKQEVVFLMGPPAVGKTFFFHHYFSPAGYISISPDLITRPLALASLKEHLSSSSNQSIILDSRFPTAIERSKYISFLINEFPNVIIRLLYFSSPLELCKHNSYYRSLASSSSSSLTDPIKREESERGLIKEDEFLNYSLNEKIPIESEGFYEIKKIQFSFKGDEEGRKNWNRWLWAGKKLKLSGTWNGGVRK